MVKVTREIEITREEFNRLAMELILIRMEVLKCGSKDVTAELPILICCAQKLI